MYFRRNVSIFHLRSEDVEIKTIFFAVEERRVVHRLETIWWSHADDNGDDDDGDNDEGISPPKMAGGYFLATFHSWSPPSQAQVLVGEEPSAEIPQVEKRMGWTCPYFWP